MKTKKRLCTVNSKGTSKSTQTAEATIQVNIVHSSDAVGKLFDIYSRVEEAHVHETRREDGERTEKRTPKQKKRTPKQKKNKKKSIDNATGNHYQFNSE